MWERSGGNARVGSAVADWNERPRSQINLNYIPHAEMVPQAARHSLTVRYGPEGLDLIYGPHSSAGQLETSQT